MGFEESLSELVSRGQVRLKLEHLSLESVSYDIEMGFLLVFIVGFHYVLTQLWEEGFFLI